MELKNVIEECHDIALSHGWWDRYFDIEEKQISAADDFEEDFFDDVKLWWITAKLMLVVTEIAEAVEGLREEDTENFGEELADVIIRTFDIAEGLAGKMGFDLAEEIEKKMEKNKDRPYRHNKRF